MPPTKRRDRSWLAINGFASDGIGEGLMERTNAAKQVSIVPCC